MNDAFLRQRVNSLTGLTKYDQLTASAVAISTINTWTDIYSNTDTAEHTILWCYQISLSAPGTGMLRILAKDADNPAALDHTDKIFPFGAEVDIISGAPEYLHMPLQIPKNHKFSIQAKVSVAMSVTLDYFSIVKVPTYNHRYTH